VIVLFVDIGGIVNPHCLLSFYDNKKIN